MSGKWTHLLCERCWNILEPARRVPEPPHNVAGPPCCRCGAKTRSGIWYRAEPSAMLFCDHDWAEQDGGRRTLYWRPCPFFCPAEEGYFRSWADLMAEASRSRSGVTIDVPESVPFPRGTHDLSGVHLTVTPNDEIRLEGDDAGARCDK